MSMNSDQWDDDLVNDIFIERDANLILSIPMQRIQEDSWYWRGEKMGFYSVKSAYAKLRDQKEASNARDNPGFWRKLWNLKIPLKVKHFLWRANSGTLPTKDILISRRVNVCSLCPVCNINSETTAHVLVNFDFSKLCWERADLRKQVYTYSSFTE